ncbi:MAG: GNAT family N-acetyltransferase [Defluviitaleaceae bacterium]|nr:GNAT family N-acetyltransferase [Defluviitaleaceae bacterium]
MLIRWATKTDLPAWYELATEVSQIFQHPADMGAELKSKSSGLGSISRHEMLTAVDSMSGNNLGFICFSRKDNAITWFAVSEKYREKGVGGKLLQTALWQLDTTKDIVVRTFPTDYPQGVAARTLYMKYGFTIEKPTEHNGLPRSEMKRPAIRGVNTKSPVSNYINLNRIEFVITNACSGKCKHCSWGVLPDKGRGIDADLAVSVVKQLAERFEITSLMTFGGEPLLFADTVCKIHAAARDVGIDGRSIITNGFFSKDESEIDDVAKNICASGANCIMLSVDAFHQEFVPIDFVLKFAEALLKHEIPQLEIHPAWVVNEEHENAYNVETKRLLKIFTDKGIAVSDGNNISLFGNAQKYLSEFYLPMDKVDLSAPCGSEPYSSRPDSIDCISINPNGDVIACEKIGNIHNTNILDIIDNYDPHKSPAIKAVLDGGVSQLLLYAESLGITTDISDCHSACRVCEKVREAINEN